MKKIILALVMVITVNISMAAFAEEGAYFKIGDYNEDVIQLHQKLSELGYFELRPASPWSVVSERALKMLQENLNMPTTGTVDSRESYEDYLSLEYVIGRNLLTDYETTMRARGYESTDDTYLGNLTIHCDNKAGDASECKDIVGWSGLLILPDTDYTLSFWAKGEGVIHSYLWPSAVREGWSEQGRITNASDGNIISELSDDWQKFVITWRTVDTIDEEKRMLPVRVYGGNEVWISQIKLEAGNRATEWN